VGVLVASDIAARGLDVAGISHVVNFDLPGESDTYVHRIGRCGRAGTDGQAWSLCAPEERDKLTDIERGLGGPLAVAESPAGIPAPPRAAAPPPAPNPRTRSGPPRRRGPRRAAR